MPAELQGEAVSKKLVELNPGFDGKLTPVVQGNFVKVLTVSSGHVSDLSPIRALVELTHLDCQSNSPNGLLSDLSPLSGMSLTVLDIQQTQVANLSPLKGMPLTRFDCTGTKVIDFTPLMGMPLIHLGCGSDLLSSLSSLKGIQLTSIRLGGSRVTDLSPLKGMPLDIVNLAYMPHLHDLSPLKGMQLTRLACQAAKVADLSPLEGMPLTYLNLLENPVSDLSPLKNLPLKELAFDFKLERDTELLRSIKTLETINGKPTTVFWKEVEEQQKGKKLGFQMPGFDQWAKNVQAMPAEKQVEAVSEKFVELNPGFNGKMTGWDGKDQPKIENGIVTEIRFVTDNVTDISPVRALVGLHALDCSGSTSGKGHLTSLGAIGDLKLKLLQIANNPELADLSPLRGMSLTVLACQGTRVSDLSPLTGMPLSDLRCFDTKVSNLLPLARLPLTNLDCGNTSVTDLLPLAECAKLQTLTLFRCKVTPAGVAALQTALPNCEIRWNDPAKLKSK